MTSDDHRTVAFLDILGFKNKVSTTPAPQILREYERVVDTANALLRPLQIQSNNRLFPDHQGSWCDYYIFSDSLLLYSMDHTSDACLKLLVFVWRFFQLLLGAKFPVRGAVSFGEFHSSRSKNIFLGRALLTAFELEKVQDWIGITLDQSVTTAFPELQKAFTDPQNALSHFFPKYDVPFKTGGDRQHTVINWRKNMVVQKGTRKLFSDSSESDIAAKVNNTLAFAKRMIGAFPTDDRSLPIELKIMYIGGSTPPFLHGDEF